MEEIVKIDLSELFALDIPLLEIFIRGTVMYLFLFVLIQKMNRNQAGKISNTNFLLIVLLADVSQNGISGQYNSLTSGILLVLTVFFWSYLLNWLGQTFTQFGKILYPPPLEIVEDGKINNEKLKQSLLTREELWSQMRSQGIDDIKQVKKAFIEGDGSISFLKKA